MLGNTKANLIKRNFPVIIAFVIPVLILGVIFICKGIVPFGEEMYLRSDMYHQYAPFMRMFQRTLQEGGHLLYSWDIGLGANVLSTYAYYLASPINWAITLFPASAVPAVMDAFIVLKCGLMSATLTYYLLKHFKRISYFAPAFGIFYAMSAYMAAFSWNLMWLDCLVLLPLIILGLEKLVKEKKVVLYVITLTIAIISNYYIAIMIAIFLVIYFIYLMICDRGKDEIIVKTFRGMIGRIGSFVWYSALSGFMAMAVLLPAIFALSQTASGDFDFPNTFTVYNNMLEVLSKGAILTEPAVFSGYFPNIYASVALFVLVPLFWTNMKIKLARKVGLTVIIAFFLFCFDTNIPTYIWHGFHFPNSLPCRQSFIYIAIVLIVAYEAMIRYKQYSITQLALVGGWGILGNIVFYLLFKDEAFTLLSGLVTIGFIIIYTLIMIFLKNKRLGLGVLTLIFLAISTGEAAFNTAYTGYSTASYSSYVEDNDAISALVAKTDKDDFFRMEKTKRRTKNDGTWSDYKSASVFSSTSLAALSDFYDGFGMQSSMNAFSYYGHTPFSALLLGIKYEFSKSEIDDRLMTLVDMETYKDDKTMYLYENDLTLGLGYAVDEYDEDNINMEGDDPFECQNEFAYEMTGIYDLYDIQPDWVEGEIAKGTFENDGRGFIYITDRIETATVVITRDGIEISEEDYDDLENPQIIDLGDVKENDHITVTAVDEDDEAQEISLIMATMDYSTLEDVYDALSETQMDIIDYGDEYINATIDIPYGKKLFTTIPADTGWKVKVDGEEVEHDSFIGAFITLDLAPGSHELEFQYDVPGRKLGVDISLVALALFIVSLIVRRNIRLKYIEGFEHSDPAALKEIMGNVNVLPDGIEIGGSVIAPNGIPEDENTEIIDEANENIEQDVEEEADDDIDIEIQNLVEEDTDNIKREESDFQLDK